MSVLNDIAETIRDIAHQKANERVNWYIARIKSVDDSLETCVVDIVGDTYSDVRLTAVETGNCDFRFRPAVGSFVLVADMSNGFMDDLAVLMYSNVELIEIGTAEHTMANADILANELQKLSTRVDAIYNAIQNAKPQPDQSGAGLQSSMVLLLGNPEKEKWNDIQNEKIKHG